MSKRTRDTDQVKKRKMARTRFRNLVRSVSINRIWLVDAGDQKFSLNVKKNIAMLVRTKRKIGLLTMAEKSLIRKHHALRTIDERKKLMSLMVRLNCFNKIQPKARARLSKCVKFMIIGPGRKLIQEGDSPLMVYFILTGEVEVSQNIFDHIQNCWVNRIEKICGPGDCLGDIELIERSRRRHTYITRNVVELLVVFEEDFERVLRPVMEQQWTEKKTAIMALDYFKFFTRDQITSACKLCILRQFEPLETIYYEDKGHLSYVHFVISGECMILQCLKMMVGQRRGTKTFELADITKEDPNSIFQSLSNTELFKVLRDSNNSTNKSAYEVDDMIASDDNETVDLLLKKRDFEQSDLKNIERGCRLFESRDSKSKESLKMLTQNTVKNDPSKTNINNELTTKAEYIDFQKNYDKGDVDIVKNNEASNNNFPKQEESQKIEDEIANEIKMTLEDFPKKSSTISLIQLSKIDNVDSHRKSSDTDIKNDRTSNRSDKSQLTLCESLCNSSCLAEIPNVKDLLSKIVLDKLDIIEDSRIDTNTNKKKKDAWNAIHLLFNQVTTHNRTLDQIQNQWRKTKSLVKTNNSAFIKNTKQTGGGPAPKPLSSVEEELVSRLPKHFEIDTNIYDSNSQKNEPSSENVDVSEINKSISADDEIFNTEGDTPIKEIKKTINFKRKRTMKCQCEIEKENVRRIELLDLSIKQKALEIKLSEENHIMQKRKYEMLEQQEKEEHTLRVEKIKLEIEKLKKSGFFN